MFERIARLFGTAPSRTIDVISRQVAETSFEAVCQRVASRANEMTLSEARGYVRARAAQVVRRQTRLAISRNPDADLAWTSVIARTATERIVPLVVRQVGVGVPGGTASRAAA